MEMATLSGEFRDRKIPQFIPLDRLVWQSRAEDRPGRIDDDAAHPVSGCGELNQIVYSTPDNPLAIVRRRLSPLRIVQQQPSSDLPFLRSRRPQVPIEILGRDRRQSLGPVREFPGDAEIVEGRKPVPQRNRFGTTTRIAWRTQQILAEFAFRSEPKLCASVLCDHAESRPLCVAA